MRMLLKMSVPVAKGNQAIQDGTLARVMENTMGTLKPEAAYFFSDNGRRGGFMVFDMADPSQIPVIAEPLFQEMEAELVFYPVMNQEDLAKGLTEVAQAAQG